MNLKKTFLQIGTLIITLAFGVGLSYVFAFGPTGTPPLGGNPSLPLTATGVTQWRAGALALGTTNNPIANSMLDSEGISIVGYGNSASKLFVFGSAALTQKQGIIVNISTDINNVNSITTDTNSSTTQSALTVQNGISSHCLSNTTSTINQLYADGTGKIKIEITPPAGC